MLPKMYEYVNINGREAGYRESVHLAHKITSRCSYRTSYIFWANRVHVHNSRYPFISIEHALFRHQRMLHMLRRLWPGFSPCIRPSPVEIHPRVY